MRLKKISVIIFLISYFGNSQTDKGPYFATGIRIGDVSQNEAVIWTRLTKNKVRINDAPLPISLYIRPETGKRHLRETRVEYMVNQVWRDQQMDLFNETEDDYGKDGGDE